MKIFVADTYEGISKKAANDMIGLMRSFKNPLLCVASGDTPEGLYKEIVDKVNKNELDISAWSFVGLDEWIGSKMLKASFVNMVELMYLYWDLE